MSNQRAMPFYCPYCGEEDLFPEQDGGWLCTSCSRVFSVTLTGLRFGERS